MSGITIPPVTLQAAPPLITHLLPVATQENERIELATILLSSFAGECSDPHKAASKMVALICTCIPEMAQYLATHSGVQVIRLTYPEYVEAILDGRASGGRDLADWGFDVVDPECITVTSPTIVYACSAVAWMTYAKSAGESSRTALEEARPKMMKGKYIIRDDEPTLFPGDPLGPTLECLEQANLGIALNSRVRYMMTAFFIAVNQKGDFPPANLDPFVLIFEMLRNIGMTHVGAITKFVKMCPWALKVPELASDFNYFATELREMATVSPSLRPYHRLLVPQSEFRFMASNLKPLIAVAGSFVREVEVTFKDYVYDAVKYDDLIKKVRSRAPSGSVLSDVASLESIFGVVATDPKTPMVGDQFVQQSIAV